MSKYRSKLRAGKRPRRRHCRSPGCARPALFRVRGGAVQRGLGHDLCRQCFEAALDRSRARKFHARVRRAGVYGVCRKCGCTDERACPQGCAWTDETHTLCTACEGKE